MFNEIHLLNEKIKSIKSKINNISFIDQNEKTDKKIKKTKDK